jgi:hypothetical protein
MPKFHDDFSQFYTAWPGGYYEGNPLDPQGKSMYPASIDHISILHATYLRCIKPYIDPSKVALEIGPGRGAWTKTMLGFKEVWAMDAVSPEDTGFNKYVGILPHVYYKQVYDFSCSLIPDFHFDYMFSTGTLCHITFDGIAAYAENLMKKLKYGADCFWMVADYKKFSQWMGGEIPVHNGGLAEWHDAGVERTCQMLTDVGYKVIDPDVGTMLRDPVIYFKK